MNVNNVTVNNQYNQFDRYVLGTGASTNGSEQENTRLQEIIDEYTKDTVMLGNNNEAENKYRETLERLNALFRQLGADFLAKDRTYVPQQGPQPGDTVLLGKELLPGWSPYVNVPRPPELDNPPTGMYNPVTMMQHYNAVINHVNAFGQAILDNYNALSIELRRQFNEWMESDDYKQKMEKVKETQAFVEAMPKGELVRFEDMDPERLVSVWGKTVQQADSD